MKRILEFFAFKDFVNPIMSVFGKTILIILALALFAIFERN